MTSLVIIITYNATSLLTQFNTHSHLDSWGNDPLRVNDSMPT